MIRTTGGHNYFPPENDRRERSDGSSIRGEPRHRRGGKRAPLLVRRLQRENELYGGDGGSGGNYNGDELYDGGGVDYDGNEGCGAYCLNTSA